MADLYDVNDLLGTLDEDDRQRRGDVVSASEPNAASCAASVRTREPSPAAASALSTSMSGFDADAHPLGVKMRYNGIMTAADIAYAFTKERILDGRLTGGDMISEGEIADRISVSRTPVREAFLRLESEVCCASIPNAAPSSSPFLRQRSRVSWRPDL